MDFRALEQQVQTATLGQVSYSATYRSKTGTQYSTRGHHLVNAVDEDLGEISYLGHSNVWVAPIALTAGWAEGDHLFIDQWYTLGVAQKRNRLDHQFSLTECAPCATSFGTP